VSVTGGWGEKGWETENCQIQKQARKTRRIPAVRCIPIPVLFGTLC
jgi:hypothetical protein